MEKAIACSAAKLCLAPDTRKAYKRMMSIIDNIRPNVRPEDHQLIRVYACGKAIGWTTRAFAAKISASNDIWLYEGGNLSLNDRLASFDERTQAVDACMMALSADGFLPEMPDYTAMGGVEWFNVTDENPDTLPLFIIKRFYSRYLGIQTYGSVLHGFNDDGYWVSTRGQAVHEYPGKWDVLAAGALTNGQGCLETLIDEAHEEAGLSKTDLQNIVKTDAIILRFIIKNGYLQSEFNHIYELNTGKDIIPKVISPLEVEKIEKIPFDSLLESLETSNLFRPERYVMIAEFMIRHGYLNKDHPEFQNLSSFVIEFKRKSP